MRVKLGIAMKAEKLRPTVQQNANDLRELVSDVERLQAQATIGGHQFLAYLLDMARIEATTLLRSSS